MKEEYKSKTSTSTNGEFWKTYDGGIPLVPVQWVRKRSKVEILQTVLAVQEKILLGLLDPGRGDQYHVPKLR
jgi:hypothetical protein